MGKATPTPCADAGGSTARGTCPHPPPLRCREARTVSGRCRVVLHVRRTTAACAIFIVRSGRSSTHWLINSDNPGARWLNRSRQQHGGLLWHASAQGGHLCSVWQRIHSTTSPWHPRGHRSNGQRSNTSGTLGRFLAQGGGFCTQAGTAPRCGTATSTGGCVAVQRRGRLRGSAPAGHGTHQRPLCPRTVRCLFCRSSSSATVIHTRCFA